ncbi:MAG: amino acid ABC transporter substrate-binding protein, partial [Proteobacteria bacterium]|nr:amino acid ABC transporter substrate-binding protein [Pseudomonadota bacterium]
FDVPGVMAEDVLFVRVNANYAPFEMVVDGKLTGLHIELVYATASRLGVNVEFQSLPWKRAIHMVKIGAADAITYVGKTPEREKFIHYNDGNVLSSSAYGFVVLSKRADKIRYNGDLQSMRAYKIGAQLGYSYGNAFDQAKYLNKHVVKNVASLINLLLADRIDLAVIDEPEYLQNRNKDKWSKMTFLKPDIIKRNFYVGFSKKKKLLKLTNRFAKELTAFKRTKDYQRILAKYNLN